MSFTISQREKICSLEFDLPNASWPKLKETASVSRKTYCSGYGTRRDPVHYDLDFSSFTQHCLVLARPAGHNSVAHHCPNFKKTASFQKFLELTFVTSRLHPQMTLQWRIPPPPNSLPLTPMPGLCPTFRTFLKQCLDEGSEAQQTGRACFMTGHASHKVRVKQSFEREKEVNFICKDEEHQQSLLETFLSLWQWKWNWGKEVLSSGARDVLSGNPAWAPAPKGVGRPHWKF